jgi:hypothetical protein
VSQRVFTAFVSWSPGGHLNLTSRLKKRRKKRGSTELEIKKEKEKKKNHAKTQKNIRDQFKKSSLNHRTSKPTTENIKTTYTSPTSEKKMRLGLGEIRV